MTFPPHSFLFECEWLFNGSQNAATDLGENHMNQRILTATSVAAVVISMAMVGCSKHDQADASGAANMTVAQVNQTSPDVANTTTSVMDKAKISASGMAQDAKDEVSDAVITTSVKAELSKDSSLSALKVSVDTDSGRVALHGTAPSAEARDRATALAQGVKGVVDVDNALSVELPRN
jgi:hyperosmotically inducible periplasmic protein